MGSPAPQALSLTASLRPQLDHWRGEACRQGQLSHSQGLHQPGPLFQNIPGRGDLPGVEGPCTQWVEAPLCRAPAELQGWGLGATCSSTHFGDFPVILLGLTCCCLEGLSLPPGRCLRRAPCPLHACLWLPRAEQKERPGSEMVG